MLCNTIIWRNVSPIIFPFVTTHLERQDILRISQSSILFWRETLAGIIFTNFAERVFRFSALPAER